MATYKFYASYKLKNKLFEFYAKILGDNNKKFMTLSTWVNEKISDEDNALLLQMEIEEAEYKVLETSIETLMRFRVMVIEFHRLRKSV